MIKKQTNHMTTIVLFNRDLRLADNPAFYAACKRGKVLPVFILRDENNGWSIGSASQWWLHHSLTALNTTLSEFNARLYIYKNCDISSKIISLCKIVNADAVFWNRRYAPDEINADTQLKKDLKNAGFSAKSFNGSLLNEPWTILNKQNLPYKVFTPYWRECRQRNNIGNTLPIPELIEIPQISINDDSLETLNLLPKNPDWSTGIQQRWEPGEKSALKKWYSFLENDINHYEDARNIPSVSGTSYLSPHLAFGEISPRQIWHDVIAERMLKSNNDMDRYLSEIGWREFSYYQLYHFPRILNSSFNQKFDHFPWLENAKALQAWQQGLTGYPIVDAGMRELWHTGYMHNRVRMIVASFLCKDLLIHWQEGAQWFWDTLVDADLASNTASWQWTAGCGADAAPFFRIFNPITQGEKFDSKGLYTRKWLPELTAMPDKYLQKPWEAPKEVMRTIGIKLGEDYPLPIVDHKVARIEALDRFKTLKNI